MALLRATIGLSGPPEVRAQLEGSISRRPFLIGLTGLVTSSFVAQAKAHLITTGRPMLLQPKRAEETRYLFEDLCGERNKWLVCLGPYEDEEPPPPTWREYLQMQGHTGEEIVRVCAENHLAPEDLECEMDEYDWADAWDCSESPQAKAYALLKELNIGFSLNTEGQKAGRIEFIEGGSHPSSWARWVELRDDLTVSLLQAYIIERDLPREFIIDELRELTRFARPQLLSLPHPTARRRRGQRSSSITEMHAATK